MTRSLVAAAVLATSSLATALATSLPAEAGWRQRPVEEEYAFARSRFGNGTVSGPVRATRTGYEVRLPGGTWVACRRSCSETLRVETVDFFETDGRLTGYGAMTNECGIFGCIEATIPLPR